MNDLFPTYHLYCINLQCKISIYKNIKEIERPFNEENLLATHICPCCLHPLVSSMDIEIEQMTAGTGVRLPGKPHYNAKY
jgi:hypothetical protein